MSTPTCASGKFTSAYSEAARILALSDVSLNLIWLMGMQFNVIGKYYQAINPVVHERHEKHEQIRPHVMIFNITLRMN